MHSLGSGWWETRGSPQPKWFGLWGVEVRPVCSVMVVVAVVLVVVLVAVALVQLSIGVLRIAVELSCSRRRPSCIGSAWAEQPRKGR